MKIAFDAKRAFYNNTGLGNYSRNIIRLLSLIYQENKYLLFTPSIYKSIKFDYNKENTTIVTPNSFAGKVFKAYWRSYLINAQINIEKPDIYHGLSNEIPYGISSIRVKKIVTIHDLIFKRFPNLYKATDRKIYDRKFQYSAKNADIVIAVSKQTANDIEEYYNIKPEKIKVIYQSCNPLFYSAETEDNKKEIIKKYNLPKNFILYVGTIEERKNLLGLLKAYCYNKLNIPIVAIGRQTLYFKSVMEYAINNHIENNLIFIENIKNTELPAFYQLARVFVYPSIFEGFGIPVLEALASGTPVVTSNVSSLPEAAGENSILIDPNNVESIADGLQKAIYDKELRIKMIIEGRKHAKKFTEDIAAKNLMNIYES